MSPPAKTKTPSPEFAFANFSSTPFPFYKIPSHEANSEYGINGIGEEYFASDAGSNMFFPDYKDICKGFGLNYNKISNQEDLFTGITTVIDEKQSTFCEVIISSEARVNPQGKFSSPIEVMDPPLDIEIFKSLMITSPYLK